MNTDERYMRRALDLAKIGGGHVAPNPMVGAVIVHNDRIIGEGYHQAFGGPHAEVNAVAAVQNQELLSESTIYVTLEPCAHFGKTPPCADLIIQKRFKRVIVATVDPFAKVAGKGIESIRAAGIQVEIGILEKEAQELNKRFFTFHQHKRPFILLKWAQTKDGFVDKIRTSENTGINWISSPDTKTLVHQGRSMEHGILVGWKTVLNDNPSLTVRNVIGKNPVRIVVDSNLQAPKTATVFTDGLPTIVLNSQKEEQDGSVHYSKIAHLSPTTIAEKLHELGILSVMIEGGKQTLQSFIDVGIWDEAMVIVGKTEFIEGLPAPTIAKTPRSMTTFGVDTIIHYSK